MAMNLTAHFLVIQIRRTDAVAKVNACVNPPDNVCDYVVLAVAIATTATTAFNHAELFTYFCESCYGFV